MVLKSLQFFRVPSDKDNNSTDYNDDQQAAWQLALQDLQPLGPGINHVLHLQGFQTYVRLVY